jgi:hypothetical protein
MKAIDERARPRPGANDGTVYRWECRCQIPPVLLATHHNGRIHIKVRDRYWHVVGRVQAICPKCGAEHVFTSAED